MAMGFEGSKGILHQSATCVSRQTIRPSFQELIWRAAKRELSLEEFFQEIESLPQRLAVSAFVNDCCSLGCAHCYLRDRGKLAAIATEADIASLANQLNAADFSIVGMEPLETWQRTKNILHLAKSERKAIITNGMNLNEEIASYLSESNVLVDFSVGEARNYGNMLTTAAILRNAGVKATASCVLSQNVVEPLRSIADISKFGFPMVFFPFCGIQEVKESSGLVMQFIEKLRSVSLDTKILIKVDFLTPWLLKRILDVYFSQVDVNDLRTDLDEGFLVRELNPNLLLGAYPFPGEFINRIRIDADGALTTCHHMQVPLAERLAMTGDLRFQPEKWLEIPAVREYHAKYWRNFLR